jgi:hypothetical protein
MTQLPDGDPSCLLGAASAMFEEPPDLTSERDACSYMQIYDNIISLSFFVSLFPPKRKSALIFNVNEMRIHKIKKKSVSGRDEIKKDISHQRNITSIGTLLPLAISAAHLLTAACYCFVMSADSYNIRKKENKCAGHSLDTPSTEVSAVASSQAYKHSSQDT